MTKAKSLKQAGSLSYHKIGEVIRKYRKEKGLKLIDLAAKTGMGAALLSKIENGRMIPTIPTLFAIIKQLKMPFDHFFAALSEDDDFPGYLYIPQNKYAPYVKEEKASGFNYFSILEQSMSAGSFQISLVELKPGARRKMVSTEAHEYLYVLQGPIQYHLGKNIFELHTGDSLFFDGTIPHLPVNETKKNIKMLVVYFFNA